MHSAEQENRERMPLDQADRNLDQAKRSSRTYLVLQPASHGYAHSEVVGSVEQERPS